MFRYFGFIKGLIRKRIPFNTIRDHPIIWAITLLSSVFGIIMFAVWACSSNGNTSDPHSQRNRVASLQQIRPSLSLAYIKTLLGEPHVTRKLSRIEHTYCLYVFSDHYVQIVVNTEGVLGYYSVTSRSPDFSYSLPYLQSSLTIGQSTYADFGKPQDSSQNVGNQSAWYWEKHYFGNSGNYQNYYCGYSAAGFKYDGDKSWEPCLQGSDKDRHQWSTRLHPNAFAVSNLPPDIEDKVVSAVGVGPELLEARMLK